MLDAILGLAAALIPVIGDAIKAYRAGDPSKLKRVTDLLGDDDPAKLALLIKLGEDKMRGELEELLGGETE